MDVPWQLAAELETVFAFRFTVPKVDECRFEYKMSYISASCTHLSRFLAIQFALSVIGRLVNYCLSQNCVMGRTCLNFADILFLLNMQLYKRRGDRNGNS